MNKKRLKIGSICCGLGGFDLGAKYAGADTVWAIDKMKEACESFKANFPETNVIQADAHTIKNFADFGYVDGLIFGPPCQGFSIGNTKRNINDTRNAVYYSTLQALAQTDASFFIFENVRGILSMKNEDGSSFFEKVLYDYSNCGMGYNLTWKLIDCSKVGVPQERFRVIIVGIRRDYNLTYQFPNEPYGTKLPFVTLRDTIYHLRNVDQSGDYDKSGFSPMYLSRNRQRGWDELSYTIEASGRHAKICPSDTKMYRIDKDKWVVPDCCRKLSTLECKLIQTFPEDFIVLGSLNKRYEQIGNAVPPKLAEHIFLPLIELFT